MRSLRLVPSVDSVKPLITSIAGQASKFNQAHKFVQILAWTVIALGIFFRLYQLPTRTLFFDEAVTQLRIAGHTETELWQTLYDGQPRTAQTLRTTATVDQASSLAKTVASLAEEDAQHPPLFYILELGVVHILGNSLLAWRILPAIFGILSIGAAGALAQAFFPKTSAGLLAAAVFAVSPIERIYSEQAREYSLLTLIVLLATLAFLRAWQSNSFVAWSLYTLVAAAGLYTSPFMGYVLAGHFVAVLALNHTYPFDQFRAFTLAGAATLILSAPWLYQIFIHAEGISEQNTWSATTWPLTRLLTKWVFNVGSTFFDLEYLNLRWAIVLGLIAIIAVIALMSALRNTTKETRWILGAAVIVPALLLIMPDLLFGQHRSAVARYGLPVYAALAILVARGIVNRPIFATILLSAGLSSCAIGALHPSWWDNDVNGDDTKIAAIINSVPGAQVISTMTPGTVVAFSQLLKPEIPVSLVTDVTQARFSRDRPLFVIHPDEKNLRDLRRSTGLVFTQVSFPRTQTAHDIGTHIGGSGTSPENDAQGLYMALKPRIGQIISH